jgi:hypothetical protein
MNLFRTTTTIFAAFTISIFAGTSRTAAQERDKGDFYGIPAGTVIRVRMDNEINSESSDPGDTFTVTVSEPVEVDGLVVLEQGFIIEGKILEAKRSSYGRRDGHLEVIFETLFLDEGRKRDIEGSIERIRPGKKGDALSVLGIIGGAAAGAVIGVVSGSERGALIGAGIGGGTGIGVALLRKGTTMSIPAGDEFGIRLKKSVSLPAKGF